MVQNHVNFFKLFINLTFAERGVVDGAREDCFVPHTPWIPRIEANILLPLLEPLRVNQIPAIGKSNTS